MNVLTGFLQLVQQRLKHAISACKGFYTVTFERKSLIGLLKQMYEAMVLIGKNRRVLCQVFGHWFLKQATITFLSDDALPPLASAKEEIEDKPYNRQKH